ncbi:MAG: DUF695 domain-containing protein [bacterium]
MILTNSWFSTMAETDNGMPMFIAGRDDINNFIESGKFKERVEIYWTYTPSHNNMPSTEEGKLLEEVMNILQQVMEKDKLAILTGIYTGNGERTLVFYTRTSRVFGERLNEALINHPELPITLYVEIDPEWNEYHEMCEIKPYSE